MSRTGEDDCIRPFPVKREAVGRISSTDRQRLCLKADQFVQELPAWEYHVHTNYTDGEISVREAVDRALAVGLTRLVFTEHTEPWRARSPDWFKQYVIAIRMERERVRDQIELLIGLEVPAIDFKDGLEMTSEMEMEAEWIMGTAHRYPSLEGRVRDLSHSKAIDLEFHTLMALAQNPRVDAIAHIGGTCQKYCGPFPFDLTEQVIREATANGKAIDLNSSYHKPISAYLELCIKHGAWIIPGSDAHRADEIGRAIRILKDLYNGR